MKRVILVGFFQEMVELCMDCGLEIVGAFDKKEIDGVPYLGNDADALKLYQQYKDIEVVITPDSPQVRRRLADYYRSIGYSFTKIIHPSAFVSPTAIVGDGVVIQKGVNVSAYTHIGCFCRLNTHCNVTHDIVVGDYSTIAPDAVVLGYVTIGENCYVGANSTILPKCAIGDGVIVGAGAVVTKNVDSFSTVVGIPARTLLKLKAFE
jgi:sugar O-acyltransferase (sialic acid O-acetyltransferase NeuD family)